MTITLSPTLAAHQRASQRRPVLTVTARTQRFDIDLLAWSRYYTGTEADMPHAVAVPADASLLRARNHAGTVYTQRVPTPGPASAFNAWTNTATATSNTPIALAALGTEALLAYLDNAALTIQVRRSTDSGATWGAPTAIVTEASAIGALALAFTASGDACLFYTLGTSTTLKRLRRTAGVWAASGTNWTRSADVTTLTGLAACYDGADFSLLLTGTEATTTHRRTWSVRMGDTLLPANAWTALTSVAEADSASTVTFLWPTIANVAGQLHGLFVEHETGPVAFDRAFYTRPTIAAGAGGTWSEPAPHEATNAHGIALPSSTGPDVWLTQPAGVWHATRGQQTDLTARVRRCSYELTADGSTCSLTLDYHDSATIDALTPGATIDVWPGYASGAAGSAEYGALHSFTITRMRKRFSHRDGKGALLEVSAAGAWHTAERWHAPQAWQQSTGALTRASLFARIARRAGAEAAQASAPRAPSSDWTTYQPAFAIAAGESAAAALRRLLAVVPDFVLDDAGALEVRGLTAADTQAAYGGTGALPIIALALDDVPRPANWTRVQGAGRYAEQIAQADVYRNGPALRAIRNLDATTDAKASAWAQDALARDITLTPRGTFTTPFDCSAELFDAVSLTSAPLGLAAQPYRVIALAMHFDRAAPVKAATFDLTFTLGDLA